MKARFSKLFVIVLLVSLLISSCGQATETPAPLPPTEVPAAEPVATEAPVVEEPTAEAAPTEAPPTEEPKPPAPEFIEIGASIPLTGKYGSLGNMVLPGYLYAIDDINAAGGVYVEEYGVKIPLRLTYYDDESDPTKAVSKMETLYSEQDVTAYLGGAASDMHAATSAIAEKNQVPYLGVAFALWEIHQQGYKYLFSPFPKSPDQAEDVYTILNEAIPEGERPLKVAIFQETTDWGIELGGMWKENAPKFGYEVVYYAEYARAPRTTPR